MALVLLTVQNFNCFERSLLPLAREGNKVAQPPPPNLNAPLRSAYIPVPVAELSSAAGGGDEFSHHRSLSVTTTENARPDHDGTNTQEKRRTGRKANGLSGRAIYAVKKKHTDKEGSVHGSSTVYYVYCGVQT